jgi:hypothetical protein
MLLEIFKHFTTMKKFSSIFTTTILTCIFLSLLSCEKKQDNSLPIIEFITGNGVAADTTVESETELVFQIYVTSGDAVLKWFQVKELNTNTSIKGRTSISGTEYTQSIEITAPIAQGQYIYEFTVMDEAGNEVSESIEIKVVRTPGEIVKYFDILYDTSVNNEYMFFSCSTGESYTTQEDADNNQEKIDIIFFGSNYISSPANAYISSFFDPSIISDWTTINETTIFNLTMDANDENDISAEEFYACEDDELFYYFEGIPAESLYINWEGDIYGIVTNEGKHGLILVKEEKYNEGHSSKSIIFDIIIQK